MKNQTTATVRSANAWRSYLTFKIAVAMAFAFTVLVIVALSASVALSANPKSNAELMQSFIAHVDSLSAIADRHDEIKETIAQYDDSITDAVTEGLIQIYPEYATAVESSDADRVDEAVKLLRPLTSSEDKLRQIFGS